MSENARTTKKKRCNKNSKDAWKKLESSFDIKTNIPLECVYRTCGQREKCDVCDSSVCITDDGFLTCTNTKCSIIYKDIVYVNISPYIR